MAIKHIWFDFSDTIASIDKEKHSLLKYKEYADLKGVELSQKLRDEYDESFSSLGNSNSNVFVTTFNLPASYWPELINKHLEIYTLEEPMVPEVLNKLAKIIPISVFSNIDSKAVMTNLGIDVSIFSTVLSSSELRYPKPHTEGYEKIVTLSNLSASEILYIGDDLKKDVLPAKSVGLLVGYMWGKCTEADFEFKSFSEIETILSGNRN